MGRGTLGEIWEGSGSLGEVRDGSGDPRGGTGRVERPLGRSRMDQGILEGSGMFCVTTPEGPGWVKYSMGSPGWVEDPWGGTGRVGGPSGKSGTGQGTHKDVLDGSGEPWGSPGQVGGPS